MHESATVEISRSADVVFDAITTSVGAEIWYDKLVSMKHHSGPTSGVGSTHVEMTDLGLAIVEIIGVIIEEDRPNRSVTAIRYVGFHPPPLERLVPGESMKTKEELERQFRTWFGRTPPEGLVIIDVTPLSANQCTLTYTLDIKVKGIFGLTARLDKLIRQTPARNLLSGFKTWIETPK